MSQQTLEEGKLVTMQANELKYLAVQIETQREEINGRKPGIKCVQILLYFPLQLGH